MNDTPDRPHSRKSDQVLDGLTWGKIQRVGGAIATIGGIVVAVVTFFLATLVTKPQLDKASKELKDSISSVSRRVGSVEQHQEAQDSIHGLLVPMAKLECIRLDREHSATLSKLAGLPCDKLVR